MRNTAVRLIVLLSLATATPAFGQAVEVAAATTVASGALRALAKDLQELANRAQAEATLASFNISSDLLILAENLSRMALEVEGKFVKDLTVSEQKIIADVRTIIREFGDEGRGTLEKLDTTVLSVGQELSRVPGIADTAFVTALRPTFAVVGSNDSAEWIEVVAQGSLLGHGTQELAFGTHICQTLAATERTARFRCKSTEMWQGSDGWASGRLTITKPSPWWMFWKGDDVAAYPAAMKRIDRVLGHARLTATVMQSKTETIPRNESREVRSAPCETNTANWAFNPQSGCTIDVTSIRVARGPVSSRSSFNGIQRQQETGFIVQGVSRGSGERVFGECVGGGRGVVIARASWNDVCTNSAPVQVMVAENHPIEWGSDLPLELPLPNDGFLLTVTQADGQSRSLTQGGPGAWFNVEHDAVTGSVVIKPKPLEEALR